MRVVRSLSVYLVFILHFFLVFFQHHKLSQQTSIGNDRKQMRVHLKGLESTARARARARVAVVKAGKFIILYHHPSSCRQRVRIDHTLCTVDIVVFFIR